MLIFWKRDLVEYKIKKQNSLLFTYVYLYLGRIIVLQKLHMKQIQLVSIQYLESTFKETCFIYLPCDFNICL